MKKWEIQNDEGLSEEDLFYLNNLFTEKQLDYINNPLNYGKKRPQKRRIDI